jgi:dephospho-CoA kinase
MRGPVIVEYDRRRATAAERGIERLRDAVAPLPGSAEFVCDHIGSTAVPGLAAKPIIDLQLLVPRLPGESAMAEALAPLGFELARGSRPDSPGVRFDIPRPAITPSDPASHIKLLFHRPSGEGEFETILHVRLAGSPFADFVLAFRDWLRVNEDEARRYEQTKRALAAQHASADDYDDYTRAKTAFLDDAQARMGWPPVKQHRRPPTPSPQRS